MLKENNFWQFIRGGFFGIDAGVRHWICAFLAVLFFSNAGANVIDSIDIARLDGNARIEIRFSTEIQYLRHGPEDEGKFLRVFFRVANPGFSESEVMQETLRSPRSNLIPRFTVSYPELINGMLITFAKKTKFSVHPGKDNRSIIILVPLAADQKSKAPIPPAAAAASGKTLSTTGKGKLPEEAVTVETPATTADVLPAAPAQEEDKAALPPPLPPEKVEAMAKAFMADGREAFEKGEYAKAINRMNRVLGFPKNTQTEAAQAFLGEAREKNGEIAKARAEYELYLKLYPQGSESSRIKQRLAALPSAEVIRPPRAVRDDKPAEWQVTGSVSSYFFTGRSKTDSGPKVRDQESLVSTASVNARLRDSVTDTRFVFRDTDNRNFMQPSRNYNRVYAAYAERTDREAGYFVRAGRQNPNGAGVLERFDGITGSYNLGTDWKASAVYGEAVEFGSPSDKKFYGASIEFLPQIGRPGASLYLIEQNIDGFLNRRAVGSEFRYFDGQFTGFGMLDYDVLYKGMNIAMAQGNYLDQAGNNYFVSYDYRKSPSYSLTNALSTAGVTTIEELVNNVGIGQARQLVANSTAAATLFGAGMTIPVGERWQFGVDYRMSSISGTNAQLPLGQLCKELQDQGNPNDPLCVDGPRGTFRISEMGLCQPDSFDPITRTCVASQSASGRTHIYSAQAIGTNLFVPNAIGVAYLGWTAGPNYNGQNLGVNYIYPFAEDWRLETNLRYYTQKSDDGQKITQFSPSLKLAYQWRSSLFLESEIGYSIARNSGATESTNKREYLYLGIRWDYR